MTPVQAFEIAAKICEEEARRVGYELPDAHGGNFAKKFAGNALMGCAALIRKRAAQQQLQPTNATTAASASTSPTRGIRD